MNEPIPVKFGMVLRGGDLDWTVITMKAKIGGLGDGDLYRGLVIAEGGKPVPSPWFTAPQPFWPSTWEIVDDSGS